MKKVFILMMALSLTILSCKKDDTDEDNNVTTENAIKMKIDNGAEIIFKDNFAAMVVGGRLIIGAANTASNSDIQISLDPSITTGTYTTGFLISHGVNGQAVFTTATNATSNTLEITAHDTSAKHIKGTFVVHYNDNNNQAAHVAEGNFDIKYQ